MRVSSRSLHEQSGFNLGVFHGFVFIILVGFVMNFI